MQVVQIIDHDPEGIVGVVDTPHGGVEVPAEPKSNEGRAMRPHNQAQPQRPPCYAPVEEDHQDNDFYHEQSSYKPK